MDTAIQQAIDLANAGHEEQALQRFREIARRDPSQAAAFKWIAHLTTDPREAYAAIRRVLHLDPDDQWALEYAARLQAWARQQQAQSQAYQPHTAAQHTGIQHSARRSSRGSALAVLVTAVVLVLAGGALLLALIFGPWSGIGSQDGPVIPDRMQAGGSVAIVPGGVDELVSAEGLVTSTPVPTVYVTDIPAPTSPPPTANQESTQQPVEEIQPEPTDPSPTEIAVVSSVPILYDPQTTYYTFEAETIPQIQDALLLYGPSDVGADGSHAIATTTYDMGISWKTVEVDGACSLVEASITLDLVYLYPQWNTVGSPAQEVYDEWDRFMVHVVDHEEHHAEIAYGCAEELAQMVLSADISGPCRLVSDQMNALAAQMYQTCDQRQMAFDDVEGQTTFPLP